MGTRGAPPDAAPLYAVEAVKARRAGLWPRLPPRGPAARPMSLVMGSSVFLSHNRVSAAVVPETCGALCLSTHGGRGWESRREDYFVAPRPLPFPHLAADARRVPAGACCHMRCLTDGARTAVCRGAQLLEVGGCSTGCLSTTPRPPRTRTALARPTTWCCYWPTCRWAWAPLVPAPQPIVSAEQIDACPRSRRGRSSSLALGGRAQAFAVFGLVTPSRVGASRLAAILRPARGLLWPPARVAAQLSGPALPIAVVHPCAPPPQRAGRLGDGGLTGQNATF